MENFSDIKFFFFFPIHKFSVCQQELLFRKRVFKRKSVLKNVSAAVKLHAERNRSAGSWREDFRKQAGKRGDGKH